MLQETIEPAWQDAFEAVLGRCAVRPGDTVAVLSESQSRPVLTELARLAAARLGAQVFSMVLPSAFGSGTPVARSTGASPVLRQMAPVVSALAGSTLVVDCTVEGLMHAPELPAILKGGARVLYVSNEHPEALARLVPDDTLEPLVKEHVKRLRGARQMRVTSPAGTDLTIYLICSAMRTAARSLEIAELAVRWRDAGCVGFDIAGAEAGYPPTRHLDAFQYVQRENFHTTIHAGEAFGLPSIWEALQFCGAERLGHGVRIVDDISGPTGDEQLGRLAAYVRDRRIALELCPTSNVGTGVCATIADHPIGMLRRLRFRVTLNTDNRLMSATSMTKEMEQLHAAFDWDLDDFEWLTINSMKSAFAPFPERLRIINGVIKPRYAMARAGAL